jgi:hypothetical protein
MNLVTKYKSWWIIILFGIGYATVGISFPNPSAPRETQLMWRLAAWITSTIIFGIQIWYEHFRFHNLPRTTALHVAIAAALGAFALAVAANIHALYTIVDYRYLLVASLILWPIIIGVPAFVFAIIIATILAKIKPMVKP